LKENFASIYNPLKFIEHLYKQISLGHSEEIYDMVNSFGTTEKDYYIVRGGGKKLSVNDIVFEPTNNIEKAAQFYYLRKTCFRGMLRYNSAGKFNIPWGKYKTVNFDDLKNNQYSELLKRTDILIGDYTNVFKTYNSEDNFVFIDQPYDSNFNDYGFDDFNREKQIELFNIFTSTDNQCLMVVGGSEFIRELYSDYIKFEYPKNYAFKIHSGRVGDEININHLVITNYSI
jgi:DNA adenine methylase